METPKQSQIRRIYCFKLNRCPLTQPPPLWLDLGQTGAFLRTKIPCKILWSSEPGFFFPGISSIRHYSYVSINPSLDKKWRKTKRKSEEEILALREGASPALPWVSILAAFHFPPQPGPSRFVPCRRITAGTKRSSLNHCFFGRERRVESEGESEQQLERLQIMLVCVGLVFGFLYPRNDKQGGEGLMDSLFPFSSFSFTLSQSANIFFAIRMTYMRP